MCQLYNSYEKGGDFLVKMSLSDFGKEVKIRLIEIGEDQTWLIEQVRERTGDYFDTSYLSRLLRGDLPGDGRGGKPGKAAVIREILGIGGE